MFIYVPTYPFVSSFANIPFSFPTPSGSKSGFPSATVDRENDDECTTHDER
jgi:hypothetical protein